MQRINEDRRNYSQNKVKQLQQGMTQIRCRKVFRNRYSKLGDCTFTYVVLAGD